MGRKPLGDVVVLLPGITGSVLRRNGKKVWAFSGGAIVKALFSFGGSIRSLKLDGDPPEVDDLGDGVTADEIMPDIHMIPGLWKIDGYTAVARWIQQEFEADPGRNFFELPYDWRRDNRVAARKLARRSHDWLKQWRESSGNADAKLILVGHSMGGLVSRYFIECMDGWRDTRMLLTFGTPYRGSLNSLGFLANGFKKSLGPITLADLSTMLRSFTSVYQLLPIYRCYDPGDGKPVRVTEAPIPNVDTARAKAARAFHDEIADAVKAHEKDDAYLEGRYDLRPVVGTFQPTMHSARAAGDGVEMLATLEGKDLDGDGTVPRPSATPIELKREAGAMFSAERHASLQNTQPVLVQLAGLLSGIGVDLPGFRAGARIAFDLEDAYPAGQPVAVRARPESEGAGELTVAVRRVGRRGPPAARVAMRASSEGWYAAEVPPLEEGAYRATVAGAGLEPVNDVFAVIGEREG